MCEHANLISAGSVGGVLQCLSGHPLDTVTTEKMQLTSIGEGLFALDLMRNVFSG